MHNIDCLGDMCPVPVLKTKAELKKVGHGKSVKVETDHSCVLQSLLDNFREPKYSVAYTEVMNGIWEIVITKN
ncbi:MAG: sulfurtransferase TusA family protein [Clostridiaceae bacterium]